MASRWFALRAVLKIAQDIKIQDWLMWMNKKPYFFLFLVIIVGAIIWWYPRPYPPKETLTSHQEANVQAILKEMKTRCIGRYLIDLPASFSVNRSSGLFEGNHWVAEIGMADDSRKTYITTRRMYYPAFEQFIQRRGQEIAREIVINPLNKPYLKKVWTLPNKMKGIIFERNEDAGTNDAIRVLEAYLYTNGVAVKLQKESVNDSDPRYKDDRNGKPIRNYIPRDIERMTGLLARITGRAPDDIPTVPGSCIADAFISTDKYGQEQEDIYGYYTSDALRGFQVSVEMDNYTQESDTVLERAGDIASALSKAHGHIVRKGAFNVNGLHAEELLAAIRQPSKDEPRYGFDLFINEMTASYKTPGLIVSLNNLEKSSETYSEEEIIAFWDAITRTIRLKPGAY
ncbi:hypothetical protein AGJ36_21170 [Cronobacter dublinensis subsp. dublinensis]|nr:hypothetical protein [Cronobacter dublinensis subsp. dublinensis]